METDWEAVYRSWKQGLGWRNRVKMFIRCERWLGDMQKWMWQRIPGRTGWGTMANYILPSSGQENEDEEENELLQLDPQFDADETIVQDNEVEIANEMLALGVQLFAAPVIPAVEEMPDVMYTNGYLSQFQWP